MNKDENDILSRGLIEGKTSILYMLTGSEGHVLQYSKLDEATPESVLASDRAKLTDEALTDQLLKTASNQDKYASVCSFKKQNFLQKLFGSSSMASELGYSISLVIQSNEGGVQAVVLKNPWDSSKEIIMPFDEFKSQVTYFVTHDQEDTI